MKRSLLVIFVLLGTLLKAQFTFTKPAFGIVVGDTRTYYTCDTTGITAGNGGAGVIFNYSNLSVTSGPYQLSYVDPINTPYSGVSAGVAVQLPAGDYAYYTYGTLAAWQVEKHDPNQSFYYYDNMVSDTIFGFPFHYNDMKYSILIINAFGPISGPLSATTAAIYDGYGTLQLPGAVTINNVARVRTVQVTSAYIVDAFDYYDSTSKFPVLSILDSNVYGWPAHHRYVWLSQAYALQVEVGKQKDISLYPNPCHDLLHLNMDGECDREIEILNHLGQVLYHEHGAKQTLEIPLALLKIPPGMYVLSVRDKKGRCIKKMIVE